MSPPEPTEKIARGHEDRVTELYEDAVAALQVGGEEPRRIAKQRFEKLLATAPTFSEGHFQLARLLFEEGQRDEAVRHAEEAVRLFPQAKAYRILFVTCLAALDRFADAAQAIQDIARDIPSLSDKDLHVAGDERTVVGTFIRRNIASIFTQFALVRGKIVDVPTALADILRGLASANSTEATQAEYELEMLVAQLPHAGEARFYLVEHLRRTGRPEEALARCEDAERQRYPDWPLLIELGALHAALGHKRQGMSYFEEAALLNEQLPSFSADRLSDAEREKMIDWYRSILDGLSLRPGAYQMVWRISDSPLTTRRAPSQRPRFLSLLRASAIDIVAAIRVPQIWWTLAKNDIASRYRRTVLGPWWIVLGSGLALLGMAVVWSTLFNMDLAHFFPYLSAGYVIWMFFSSVLTESCNSFLDGHAQAIQKNIDIPRFIHVLRLMARNSLLFLHALSIVVVSEAIFSVTPTAATLLAIPGFALAILTLTPLALVFGICGARFRDFGPAITAFMTIIFFVTPVMWQEGQLGRRAYLAAVNPFTHLLAIMRDPLLGTAPPLLAWLIVACLCVALWLTAIAMFARTRHRIVYWL